MEYDYNALYGQADTSTGALIEARNYDAVVETATWGPTKGGDKGTWEIKFRITDPAYPGFPLTTNLTVSPTKTDGTVNTAGLGILFRQLSALGIPTPQEQPQWWGSRGVETQIAQLIVGKPALIKVIVDTEYDDAGRNKIRDIRPARPGAPTDWPRAGGQPQQGYQQGAVPGQPPAQPQQGYNPYPPQQQPPQQPAAPSWGGPEQQPGQPPQQPAYGQPNAPWNPMAAQAPQPPQQPAYGAPPAPPAGQPSPWNQPPPQQGPTQPAYGGQPQNPGAAPGYAPPANAVGPSAPQGFTPNQGAPAWSNPPQPPQDPNAPQGYPPAPPQGQQQPQGGPALPPWAQ